MESYRQKVDARVFRVALHDAIKALKKPKDVPAAKNRPLESVHLRLAPDGDVQGSYVEGTNRFLAVRTKLVALGSDNIDVVILIDDAKTMLATLTNALKRRRKETTVVYELVYDPGRVLLSVYDETLTLIGIMRATDDHRFIRLGKLFEETPSGGDKGAVIVSAESMGVVLSCEAVKGGVVVWDAPVRQGDKPRPYRVTVHGNDAFCAIVMPRVLEV